MPNGPAFDDAVCIAAATPDLGVGIHLSLVGEHCVAPPRLLGAFVDADGMLPPSYPAFAKQYLLRRFGQQELRIEIEAQMQRALATVLPFTHIDSHQHLHMMPGVLELVITAARAAGIPVVRLPYESGGVNPHRYTSRGLQLLGLTLLSRSRARVLADNGLRHADAFWGLGLSGMMTEAALLQTLDCLRPGVNEIMCHPGESDPALRQRYPWGYQWDEEEAALLSAGVKDRIAARCIRLASWKDAWEPAS